MVQVQVRVPEEAIKLIDKMVAQGRFRSRSDAIKTIIALYQEREKTRKFYEMLKKLTKKQKDIPKS